VPTFYDDSLALHDSLVLYTVSYMSSFVVGADGVPESKSRCVDGIISVSVNEVFLSSSFYIYACGNCDGDHFLNS
jgi:hypothetical protein